MFRSLRFAVRRVPVILMTSLALAGSAAAETRSGKTGASVSARVTIRLPSVHGVNVPALPRPSTTSSAVFASRGTRASVEPVLLQLISTNADSGFHTVRTLRHPAGDPFALAGSSGATPAPALEGRSVSREGAFGWTLVEDRIEAPSGATVSKGASRKITVIYEMWQF